MPKQFQPTDDLRLKVSIQAACGMPRELIAEQIINPETGKPITRKTLGVAFRKELADAERVANATVAQSLFRKATGSGAQSVTAAIFWLKTRAQWKEAPQTHEFTGGITVNISPADAKL